MSGTTDVTIGSLTAVSPLPSGSGVLLRVPSSDPSKFVFGLALPSSIQPSIANLSVADMTALRATLKLALPVFRAENYGAKFDGTTDDSAAWRALMAAVTAKGGPVCIRLPVGTSLLQGEILDLPSGSSIIGEGCGVSCLKWFGNDTQQAGAWFIDISGTDPDHQSRANCLLDFQISGNDAGGRGPAVRAYYTAHSVLDNLYFDSWNFGAIWGVQLWDTRISKIQGNFCGVGADRAAIWLRNSAAASGTFGFSNDTTNQVYIHDIRFEDSFGNDLRLEEGIGSTTHYPMNGIYVENFKGESNHRLNRSSIYIGANVTLCAFSTIYPISNHFSPYFASSNYAAHYGIENFGGGRNFFGQIFGAAQDSGLWKATMLQASTGVDHLEDVTYESPNSAPTSGNLISIATDTVQPVFTGFFTCAPTVSTLIGGGTGVYASSSLVAPGGGTALAGVIIDGSTIPATTSAPYQMATADRVVDVNKTTGAATKILLPTNPTPWVEYTIIDGKRDATTNNITITAASGTTINGASTALIQSNAVALSMRAVNPTTWRLT